MAIPTGGTGQACPALAKLCPDGSAVSATGPNCTFPACPTTGGTGSTTTTPGGTTASGGESGSSNSGSTTDTGTSSGTTGGGTSSTGPAGGSSDTASGTGAGGTTGGSTSTSTPSDPGTGVTSGTSSNCVTGMSASGTTIPSAATIIDCQGDTWTLDGGQPNVNQDMVTTVTTAPTANLCATGTASAVTGSAGSYNWSCTGANGGTVSQCFTITDTGVPPAAAAVGYNVNTLRTTAFSTSNVDMKGTYASGFQWYLFNFFGSGPTAANIVINGDGSISVGQGGNNYNATISSAGHINAAPNFVGTAFGGGAYIEAVVKFDAEAFDGLNSGWPSFWTNALECNLSTSQWPGQAAGYNHSIEADILEYFQGQWSDPLNQYSASLHDWYGGTQYGTGTAYTVNQADFAHYNTIAMLWVPATATTDGYINFYWNGNTVSSQHYTQLTDAAQPPISSTTPWAFGVIDQDHLVIEAGSNSTYPIFIQSVNVWQANANANLHN